CAQGNSEGAMRLEQLWNQLAGTHPLSVYCAYPTQAFSRLESREVFLRVCSEHSDTVGENGVAQSAKHSESPTPEKRTVPNHHVEWRQREDHFRRFVEAVQDYAIFMLDPQGNVSTCNAGAERT